MIMRNRKVFYDESVWERMEAKMKTWVRNIYCFTIPTE